jgi:hypothetical protein
LDNDGFDRNYMRDLGIRIGDTCPYDRPVLQFYKVLLHVAPFSVLVKSDDCTRIHHHIPEKYLNP